MATNYQVNEMFNTVQGEGIYVGRPSTFIRLQGCTVGCSWCDTKYTWAKGGTRATAQEIVESLMPSLQPHVVITGGEPTMYDLDDLILTLEEALKKKYANWIIQLETSGQNNLKGVLRPTWITWSPKENLNFACAPYLLPEVNEIKFVVDEALTYETIRSVVHQFLALNDRKVPVVLMPEGTPPSEENCAKALEWVMKDPNLILGDRLQWRLKIR